MSTHVCAPVRSSAEDLYVCLACHRVYRLREQGASRYFDEVNQGERLRRTRPAVPVGDVPDRGKFSKDKAAALASRQIKNYWL